MNFTKFTNENGLNRNKEWGLHSKSSAKIMLSQKRKGVYIKW